MPDESNKYEQLATSLVTAMKSVFIEVVNKVTSWSQSPSHNNIPSEKLVYDSIANVSNDLSGKENTSNKISSWSSTPSNVKYPSELLVKNSLDAKANITDVPSNLSDLTNDAGYLTEHQTLSDIGGEVTVEKQQTAETGYSAQAVL